VGSVCPRVDRHEPRRLRLTCPASHCHPSRPRDTFTPQRRGRDRLPGTRNSAFRQKLTDTNASWPPSYTSAVVCTGKSWPSFITSAPARSRHPRRSAPVLNHHGWTPDAATRRFTTVTELLTSIRPTTHRHVESLRLRGTVHRRPEDRNTLLPAYDCCRALDVSPSWFTSGWPGAHAAQLRRAELTERIHKSFTTRRHLRQPTGRAGPACRR